MYTKVYKYEYGELIISPIVFSFMIIYRRNGREAEVVYKGNFWDTAWDACYEAKRHPEEADLYMAIYRYCLDMCKA